jgi:UDP-N-acetylmuramoyl-tripeptide--D-alanyl-D-alanine ligase
MKSANSKLLELFLSSTGISTDTRTIQKGNLFFALKGPNFNANKLAKEALDKGAIYAIIDDSDFIIDERTILVEDGLKALQNLALDYRRTLNIPFIGLTGSNGKTTTKELINQVLSKKYKTSATKGNLNNHIGVPLTILSIKNDIEIAIIEMGANKKGDIKELVEIAEPTHGLITNIGKAHLEGFGGLAGVRIGKGEMYDFLKISNGKVFVPKQDPVLNEMIKEKGIKNIVYTNTVYSTLLTKDTPFIEFNNTKGNSYSCRIPGEYNYRNMEMAIAIGAEFGIPEKDCLEAVANYEPDNHRSQFIQIGSNKVFMDSYNANPTSMKLAIESFHKLEGENKIVLLGGMNELGEEEVKEHEAIGELLSKLNFETILLVGDKFAPALKYLPNAYFFPEKFGLHTWLQDKKLQNSTILIKGSRGVKLETVLTFF